jgi:endonuclease YncB( thermonuclease family)
MLTFALAAAIATIDYPATVVSVVDGDTLRVTVAGWPEPFDPIAVRVVGIDTPESRRPPAKCAGEVRLGLQAKAFAKGLLHRGDRITVRYTLKARDKYGRLLASVTLPDGSDFAGRQIAAGLARPYDGGRKSSWCGPAAP